MEPEEEKKQLKNANTINIDRDGPEAYYCYLFSTATLNQAKFILNVNGEKDEHTKIFERDGYFSFYDVIAVNKPYNKKTIQMMLMLGELPVNINNN